MTSNPNIGRFRPWYLSLFHLEQGFFVSISTLTFGVRRYFIIRIELSRSYRGGVANSFLLHGNSHISFREPMSYLRSYYAELLLSRKKFFSAIGVVFPISGFSHITMYVFLLWVFLYSKVRERWVMQVPLLLLRTFFQKLLSICLPKLFRSGGWKYILKSLTSVTHLYSHFKAV